MKAIGEASAKKAKIVNIDARKLGKPVFCLPGLGRLDDCAALIVADVLKREGFNAAFPAPTPKLMPATRTRSASAFWRKCRRRGCRLRSESSPDGYLRPRSSLPVGKSVRSRREATA